MVPAVHVASTAWRTRDPHIRRAFLAGTDVAVGPEGSRLHEELALLVGAGLSPMEAQTATRNPAEYLDSLATEGTVEAGKLADLVLLDADPLKDIANVRHVHAVVLGGRPIDQADRR